MRGAIPFKQFLKLQSDWLIKQQNFDLIETYIEKNNNLENGENLIKYYAYSFIPAPKTLYENIYQVEPGENILIDLKKFDIIKKNIGIYPMVRTIIFFLTKLKKKISKKDLKIS